MLNIIKKKLFPVMLLFMVFANGISVYAADKEVSVDIEINESMLKNGDLVKYVDYYDILPGENISKIPVIKNNADDCYLRVRYEFTRFSNYFEKELYGMPNYWVYSKEDNFWYYNGILKTGEEAKIFEGFNVPVDLPQKETTLQAFTLKITAEAIAAEEETIKDKFINKRVPTGDQSKINGYTIALCAALAILLCGICWYVKGRKDN